MPFLVTCPGKRDRHYFGHNFDKFKYMQEILWRMRNHTTKSLPHLISVATLSCELDNGHVLQSPNWQLNHAIAICVQVFDRSMTLRKVVVIAENTMSKSKQYSEWLLPALMHPERQRSHWFREAAMTAWSSLAHSLFMWCLGSSRSVMHVLYTLSCSIPHTLQSTGFKSGEFGGGGAQ